jgi:restriction endonuclease S subunit
MLGMMSVVTNLSNCSEIKAKIYSEIKALEKQKDLYLHSE